VPFECGSTYRFQYCKFSGGGSESCYSDGNESTPLEEFRAQVRTDYCPQHPTDPVCFEDTPAVGDSGDDDSGSGGGSGPGDPMPKGGSCDGTSDLPTSVSGSKIECRDRSVSQSYEIVGTPYSLTYSSRNTIGGSYADRIVTKSIRQFYPQPHYGKILKVNFITKIGDRTYSKSIPINRTYIQESDSVSQRVVWDGLDAAGQLVKGSVQGTTRIVIKKEFNPGGDGNGTIAKLFRFVMNNSTYSDRFNLGGWSISHYHSFDSASNLVFTGFGQRMPLLNLNTTPVWKTDAEGNIYIPSSDATEIYLFSPRGLHLKTFDAISNIATTIFEHDDLNRLISITDKYGNTTTLQRSATGQLTGILSPHGELTKVNINENGYIYDLQDPVGNITKFTYGEGPSLGLMLT
jgi:YD repeat-containing protein